MNSGVWQLLLCSIRLWKTAYSSHPVGCKNIYSYFFALFVLLKFVCSTAIYVVYLVCQTQNRMFSFKLYYYCIGNTVLCVHILILLSFGTLCVSLLHCCVCVVICVGLNNSKKERWGGGGSPPQLLYHRYRRPSEKPNHLVQVHH
jgi:hypothetical protein